MSKMVVNRLAPTEDPEAPPSIVEQLTLSEGTKNSILDQGSEENLATKWELWAYYACVAYFLIRGSD